MALAISSSSLTGFHARQRAIRFSLLAFLCLITLFVSSLHSKLPGLHKIAHNLAGTGDVIEASVLDDVFNSSLGVLLIVALVESHELISSQFQKLLAVSLPERTDHRDRFILQCALSNLDIEFIDGVHGDTVEDKVLPASHSQLGLEEKGSWRAHMNAIEHVVHNRLGSALIVEDDIDWDVRIKPLLRDFASSAQAIVGSTEAESYFHELRSPLTEIPEFSPYGDDFDLLWLGHCGSSLPAKKVIQLNDDSVPEPHYLHSWLMSELTPLAIFPNHTRVVTRNAMHVCSLAYAVSQKGARKILYELGLEKLTGPFDLMLQTWCTNPENLCISALPQLFDHHRPRGPMSLESDIRVKEGIREVAVTNNVRLSVAMNMQKMLNGDIDYDDQYPDTV